MSIIRFIFTGNTKKLDDAGKRAKTTLVDLRAEFRAGVSTSAKYTAAMAAAGTAIATHLVSKSLDAIDAQAKLARTLSTTIEGLEVTTRAAKLSGVELSGVEQATKDLTRRLSQAASGAGPAAEALGRLGLSAEQLSQLPLDQRISTINQAILDFIPAAERAAVAGQLFGEEGSLAMQRIDPATLRAAADDVARFGSALSDVDAAKVEQANDAMARVQQVVGSLINGFTVELAPVLTALSKQFVDTATEGGKLGEAPKAAFNTVVKGAGFAMDAVEGLRRVVQVAGQAIAVFGLKATEILLGIADVVVNGPTRTLNEFIALANKIPGVELPPIETSGVGTKVQEDLRIARTAVAEGWAGIQATLAEPLPSGQFKQFVAEAQEAADAAAKAVAPAAKAVAPAQTLGQPTAAEAIQARLDELRASYASEIELLREKFGDEQVLLADALAAKLLTEDEYRAHMLDVEQAFQDGITEINQRGADARAAVAEAEMRARMQTVGKALSDLSTLMNSESRKMFEIGKAAAIGQTVMSTFEGAQKAYASLAGIPVVGPALGAAAAAAAVAGGVARVQSIRSQSFGGGGAPTVSNTQAVNAASTPTGGGGGGESAGGGTYTLVGIDPSKSYNGRDIAAALMDFKAKGGELVLG